MTHGMSWWKGQKNFPGTTPFKDFEKHLAQYEHDLANFHKNETKEFATHAMESGGRLQDLIPGLIQHNPTAKAPLSDLLTQVKADIGSMVKFMKQEVPSKK